MKNITTSFIDSFYKKNYNYDKNKDIPKSIETFSKKNYLNSNKKVLFQHKSGAYIVHF